MKHRVAGWPAGWTVDTYINKPFRAQLASQNLQDPNELDSKLGPSVATVESAHQKTAICAVYAGFQAPDDRNGVWNSVLYSVLQSEVAALRQDGFRIVLLGDFNAHIGDRDGVGIARNGECFLDFLHSSNCVHVNGQDHLTNYIL